MSITDYIECADIADGQGIPRLCDLWREQRRYSIFKGRLDGHVTFVICPLQKLSPLCISGRAVKIVANLADQYAHLWQG